MSSSRQTALILGASRGLGLALAEEWCRRGWRVIATARGETRSLAELDTRYPGQLEIERLDIIKAAEVQALAGRLDGRSLGVLFVNAGISTQLGQTPANADEAEYLQMVLTNALAPVRAVELLQHLVLAHGAIAVMSSELGSITGNRGQWELYSSSKAALNMLMKCFASRNTSDPRALLLVCPGWVRTEMGGSGASLSIEESIPLVVDMIGRNLGKPGLRYIDRHGNTLPW